MIVKIISGNQAGTVMPMDDVAAENAIQTGYAVEVPAETVVETPKKSKK